MMHGFPIRNTNVDVWECWICGNKGVGKTVPETHSCSLETVNRDIGYYLNTKEGKFFSFLAKRLVNGLDNSNHPLA